MFTSRELTTIACERANAVARTGEPTRIVAVTATTITLSNGVVIHTDR